MPASPPPPPDPAPDGSPGAPPNDVSNEAPIDAAAPAAAAGFAAETLALRDALLGATDAAGRRALLAERPTEGASPGSARATGVARAVAAVDALKALVDAALDHDPAGALHAGSVALEVGEALATDRSPEPGAPPDATPESDGARAELVRARATGRWAYALALTVAGDFSKALEHFRRARTSLEALGRAAEARRVGTRELQALALTGRDEEALALADALRRGFESAGQLREAGQVDNNTGIILTRLGRFSDAEALLLRARRRFDAAADEDGLARAEMNLGYLYQEQERSDEAIAHLERALARLERRGHTALQAGLLVDLAAVHRRAGRLHRGLELLTRARGLYGTVAGSADAALAQLEEARVNLDLNLLDEAEALSRELLAVFEERAMPLERAAALSVLGAALARHGRHSEAEEVLGEALAAWRAVDHRQQAATIELALATLQLDRGGAAATTAARALVERALASLPPEAAASVRLLGRLLLARAELQLERPRDARRVLRASAELLADSANPDLVARCEELLGACERTLGHPERAEAHLRRAIAALERVRAALPGDDFKIAYLGSRLSAYRTLARLLLEHGRDAQALAVVERARARALLDRLASAAGTAAPPGAATDTAGSPGGSPRDATPPARAPDDAATADAADAAEAAEAAAADATAADPQAAALRRRLREVRGALAAQTGADDREAERETARLERDATELSRDLQRLTPGGAGAAGHVAAPHDERWLADLAAELAPDEALLEFFEADGELLAFLVDAGGVRARPTRITLPEVQELSDRLEFWLSRVAQGEVYRRVYGDARLRASVDGILAELHERLLAPLELPATLRRLTVVPFGPLHALPFAALRDAQGYLAERLELSLVPSLAVRELCRARGGAERPAGAPRLSAFGVPVDDIPAVRDELEDIRAALPATAVHLGEAASRAAFLEAAAGAGAVHLATHGLSRPQNPMFSRLQLADGWLSGHDLYGLRFGVELVVLSACESGRAETSASNEFVGMARAFLYAGAPAVVASLWPVKDRPTAELMAALYRGLGAGLPLGAALRRAQLDLLQRHPNPYHWAAFTVIGDADRKLPQ